jgi:hypothetical protein
MNGNLKTALIALVVYVAIENIPQLKAALKFT